MYVGLLFVAVFCSLSTIENVAGQTRIIGGVRATAQAHPYMASLQVDGKHLCGGAIIGTNVIMSAAHCIRFDDPKEYKVRVGSDFTDKEGTLVDVVQIIKHPRYARRTADFDLCLVFLSKDLEYTTTIWPARLPSYQQPVPPNINVTVLGWGTPDVRESDRVSEYLKKANLTIIETSRCRQLYPPKAITNNMFCATSPISEDACTGDSGGPLVVDRIVIGVISWGFSCADPNYPGIYAHIGNMMDFILKYTRNQVVAA